VAWVQRSGRGRAKETELYLTRPPPKVFGSTRRTKLRGGGKNSTLPNTLNKAATLVSRS